VRLYQLRKTRSIRQLPHRPTEHIIPEDRSVTGYTKQGAILVAGVAMLVVFPRFVFRNGGERRSFPPVPAGCNETEQPELLTGSENSSGEQRLL
jgi:hypothetical protein